MSIKSTEELKHLSKDRPIGAFLTKDDTVIRSLHELYKYIEIRLGLIEKSIELLNGEKKDGT